MTQDNTAKALIFSSAETPHLRIGLKWEPREADYIKFLDGGSAAEDNLEAGFMVVTGAGISAIFSGAGSLLKRWKPELSKRLKMSADDYKKMDQLQAEYLKDQRKPPFHLDLLCFCYDADKKLVETVSPYTLIPRNPGKATMAIVHSGDNEDGVGGGDDEEILIQIPDIAAGIDHMYFVIASHNYAFGKVTGARCHIVRTKDETELLASNLTGDGQKETFVFAKLQKLGDKWQVADISAYLDVDQDNNQAPDDAIDGILRSKY